MLEAISKMRLIKDSGGEKSWTLTLAIPIIFALTLSYLVSGVEVTWAGHGVKIAKTPGSDYAMTVGVWLTFLAQRGWLKSKNGNGAAQAPAA